MLKDTCVLGELQGSSYIMELELLNSARAVLVLLGQLWYRLNWAQGFVIVVQKLVWLCRVGCFSTGLLFGFFFFFATFRCSVSMLTSWVFCELSHEICLSVSCLEAL